MPSSLKRRATLVVGYSSDAEPLAALARRYACVHRVTVSMEGDPRALSLVDRELYLDVLEAASRVLRVDSVVRGVHGCRSRTRLHVDEIEAMLDDADFGVPIETLGLVRERGMAGLLESEPWLAGASVPLDPIVHSLALYTTERIETSFEAELRRVRDVLIERVVLHEAPPPSSGLGAMIERIARVRA
jgi:hypothetical protein